MLGYDLKHPSVQQLLLKNTGLLRRVGLEILEALSELQQLNLVHCDLKPSNILLKGSRVSDGIKLIDFGSSMYSQEIECDYIQSRPYRAPEITLLGDISGKIDVWSLGCVLYELFTGEILFGYSSVNENLIKALSLDNYTHVQVQSKSFFIDENTVKVNDRLYFIDPRSKQIILPVKGACFEGKLVEAGACPQLVDLLKKCLRFNPAERISISDALAHVFWSDQSISL
mgnify:FL=1